MCQSLFFDKFAGLRPATLLKKGSDTTFFIEPLRWQLLTCLPLKGIAYLNQPNTTRNRRSV